MTRANMLGTLCKPCRRCGATERYVNGECRPCSRARAKRYEAALPKQRAEIADVTAALLLRKSMTRAELQARLRISQQRASEAIRDVQARVIGYEKPTSKGRPAPVYAIGDEHTMEGRERLRRAARNWREDREKRAEQLLRQSPKTCRDLQHEMGLSEQCVTRVLRDIGAFVVSREDRVPVYAMSVQQNSRKLPMTREEAIAIRQKHLAGHAVGALELQEAIRLVSCGPDKRVRLPMLSPEVRHSVNARLCFNLGRALTAGI